jgi:hypothetical protein
MEPVEPGHIRISWMYTHTHTYIPMPEVLQTLFATKINAAAGCDFCDISVLE